MALTRAMNTEGDTMIDWDKVEFKGEKRFLSNMYPCEIRFSSSDWINPRFPNVPFDGKTYASTEHIYQAMKSNSKIWHKLIRETVKPEKTKTLARKHLKKDILIESDTEFKIRENWDDIRVEIMTAISLLKYTQHEDLREKLFLLEEDIEERNDWGDTFWGTVDGVGENTLGKILMKIRDRG